MEGRLGFVKDAKAKRKANLPVTKSELEILHDKIDEDRSKWVFFGLSEDCEAGVKALPEILDINAVQWNWFIEGARRLTP